MVEVVEDSTCKIPLIFVLSPGVVRISFTHSLRRAYPHTAIHSYLSGFYSGKIHSYEGFTYPH